MREVRVRWKKASLLSTDFGKMVYENCNIFEVAAHLRSNANGLTVIANIHFKTGKSIDDIANLPFFEVEPNREDLDPNKYIVNLTHPLVIGAISGEVSMYPPYGFYEDGLTMLMRGTVEGVRGFLAFTRTAFREPDLLSTMTNGETSSRSILTDRQLEIVTAAVNHGYYSKPRKINLRELADVLGMARSTLGEHLHRAESTMMQWAASDNL